MEPTSQRRRSLGPWLGLIFLAALAVLGLALLRVGPPPAVEIVPAKSGIGRKAAITIRAAEPSRGLSSIAVELVQGERVQALAERNHEPRPFWAFWGPRTERDELVVEAGKDALSWLQPGEATIRVRAGRAGTFLRSPEPAVTELTLPVRFMPPSLGVLSTQTNVTQGGSEVVVYRVGKTAARDGVRAGEWYFPGYPLPGGGEGERFCLFAAPFNLSDPSQIRLLAEDDVGNVAEARFVDLFVPRPPTSDVIELDDAFLSRVVPEILARSPEVKEGADLLASYLTINRDLRRLNNEKLRELAGQSKPAFLWTKPFRQLANSAVMASFADQRTYRYAGREVDQQVHLGYDLASVKRAPVLAANEGVVVWADFLGIYGNTVIVDHGYGVMTLYSHLSSMGVAVGQEVELGQELGRTGVTGLAGGDHLHFSVLLHGLPVRPIEWWDGHWIAAHLEAKLGDALPFSG